MTQHTEQESYDDQQYREEGGRLPRWITETPYWAVSAVAHLIVLLVLATIVVLQEDPPETARKQLTVRTMHEPPEYDPTKKPDVITRPEILMSKDKEPQVVLTPDVITPDIPKGVDLDQLTNKNLNNNSVSEVFSPMGASAGAFGRPNGIGRRNATDGGPACDDAVLGALHWLRRHQHPDGHWSSKDFTEQCKTECKNRGDAYTDGRGWAEFDVGVTALAILAFTGYGHTHRDGEHKEFRAVVKKAMEWLLKQQVKSDKDKRNIGRYGPGLQADGTHEQWAYNHAIATMAMAELLAMSRDRFNLSRSVEAATELCLRWQNPQYGWRYKFHEENDTSVTGWMVLALKTAKQCAAYRLLKIKKERFEPHFEWAMNWFDRCTDSRGKTGYKAPGDNGSAIKDIYPEPYPYSKDPSCMTAVSVLCRLFAGVSRQDDSIKQGIKILMQETPRWRGASGKRLSTINMYYWYYATYAMFQNGGNDWKEWNQAMKEVLLENQRKLGDEDGSWDPVGEWGGPGGRVYATAIGAMTLEVYYRFVRTTGV